MTLDAKLIDADDAARKAFAVASGDPPGQRAAGWKARVGRTAVRGNEVDPLEGRPAVVAGPRRSSFINGCRCLGPAFPAAVSAANPIASMCLENVRRSVFNPRGGTLPGPHRGSRHVRRR